MAENGAEKKEKYIYFVDGVKYETEHKTLTGRQIKERVPNITDAYSLFEENPNKKGSDRLINDNETVDLERDGGKVHLHFYVVPPATFGNK